MAAAKKKAIAEKKKAAIAKKKAIAIAKKKVAAEKKRAAAEKKKKVAAEKKKKAAEKKKIAAEKKKIAAEKKKIAAQKKKEAAEKKRIEAVRKKAEAVRKKAEAARKKAEAEAKKKEEEAKLPPIPVRQEIRKSSVLTNFEKKQQQKLLDLRDSLLDAMAGVAKDNLRLDADGGDASAFGMHQADAGSDAYDRDFALNLLSQEQDALHEIEEALKRIDYGTYGICEMSKKKIINARLEAIPFARYTVECQAQIERQIGFRGGRRLPDRGISGFMDDASGVENS